MFESNFKKKPRSCHILCIWALMFSLFDICESAMFDQMRAYITTNMTSTLISSYSNGDSVLNMADENSTYCLTTDRKVTFGVRSSKIMTKQDSVNVVYSAASSLNNYVFMISDTFAYSELTNITSMNSFKHLFGDYLVYTTTDTPSQYSVYSLSKKSVGKLDISSVASLNDHVCTDALESYVFCIKTGSASGYILDMVGLTAKTQDFGLKITDETVKYRAIHQVHGYESVIVITGERSVASVFVITSDAFYIADNKTLIHISSIRSGTDSSTLDCTTASAKRIIFNPIMGFLVRYCSSESDAPILFSSTESIFVLSTETFWAATDKIDAIYTNKYQGTMTIQYSAAAAKGVNLYRFTEASIPSMPDNCLTYSRVFGLCIRCSIRYVLVKSDSKLKCDLNQTYISSSLYDIEITKGYLLLRLNGSNYSGQELTTKLKNEKSLDSSATSLEFFTQYGEKLDPNPYFNLELMLQPSDQDQKIIRYKLSNINSNEEMVLNVRLKLSSPMLLFDSSVKTSSLRLLQDSSTTTELVLPAHAHSNFDTNTFFLCLYLIFAFSAQIFLIVVRPLKDSLRDTVKTFWVASAVMHIQVLCLLGTIGGKFRGPMDRVLTSCLKAMNVYLVFDAEVDFDGRINEYIFKSPYTDFKYADKSPLIMQSRYIWVALYGIAFVVSTIGTRNFRNIMYHIRVGILWSWAVQLLYYSLSTIYSFSEMKIYTPMATFSLIFAILGIGFLIGEMVFLKMSNFNNRKFMLSFDCSRQIVDEFIIDTGCILRTYHDVIFCLGSSFLMAVIPNRVEVLCRALIGLAIVYILSIVSQIRLYRTDPYILCYYGKLAWSGLFIILMILLIELDKNTGLGVVGIQAISYLALVIYIGCFVIVFGIVIYRWFAKQKDNASSKPEISYKTGYAIKRYDNKRNDAKESNRSTYKANPNDSSMLSRDRRTDNRQSLLDSLQVNTPARDQKSFLKSPMGSESKYKSFKLAELVNHQKSDSNRSRPNSDRNISNPGVSKLLDKFSVVEEYDKPTQRQLSDRKSNSSSKGLSKLGKNDDQGNENKDSVTTKNLFQIKESRIEEASQVGDISSDINLEINGEQTTGLRDLMQMNDRRIVRGGLNTGGEYNLPSPSKMDDLAFNSQVSLRPPLPPKKIVDDEDPDMRLPSEADD